MAKKMREGFAFTFGEPHDSKESRGYGSGFVADKPVRIPLYV